MHCPNCERLEARFHEEQDRAQRALVELTEARQKLADRIVIERAKGLLMEQNQISEDRAYKLIRSAAMNHSRRLADVARDIVAAQGGQPQ